MPKLSSSFLAGYLRGCHASVLRLRKPALCSACSFREGDSETRIYLAHLHVPGFFSFSARHRCGETERSKLPAVSRIRSPSPLSPVRALHGFQKTGCFHGRLVQGGIREMNQSREEEEEETKSRREERRRDLERGSGSEGAGPGPGLVQHRPHHLDVLVPASHHLPPQVHHNVLLLLCFRVHPKREKQKTNVTISDRFNATQQRGADAVTTNLPGGGGETSWEAAG
ncbi:hypothetical protein SAY86_005748 [Trapa natans]|uniref:Uncharacterized protein n=1 Tax=Trapa natans TaxID=22666 RepID=A0AAN7L212_TRANT|nr:hypothetical protein SAY86_005748 [Trapa natans]